jgi:SpoIID/LytB domain protein
MPSRRAALVIALGLALAAAGTASVGPARAAAQTPLPRITFAAGIGGSFLVHGTYPRAPSSCVRPVAPVLHARYGGTIEVGMDRDGRLFVIGELPVEDYVEGIAEVPRSWPMATLKAQAVAARSYGLAHLGFPDPTGEELGYDLCSTTACQVYRGLGVALGPYGDRWRKAVRQTRGEVLLYQGRPAETLYFSTSNGRTYGNDDVFGTTPLPYLRPVDEGDDTASPVSHWGAAIGLGDVGRFLEADDEWPGGRVTEVRRSGSDITVSGSGSSRTMDVTDFRLALNTWGPCLQPDRYPGIDSDGTRLPQTVPSKWFTVSTPGDQVVLEGRGWGHGVGMVQWGAYGKARRGLGYGDILAAYYGGFRPRSYQGPRTIRIGLATGLASVGIVPSGPHTVEGRHVPPAPWRITGGGRLRVGHGSPGSPSIRPISLQAPETGRSGKTREAVVNVPETSVVSLVLRVSGEDFPLTAPRTVPPGSTTLRWKVPPLPTGGYQIQSVVTDGTDIARTRPQPIRITGRAAQGQTPTTPGPTLSPTTSATASPASPSPAGDEGTTDWRLLALMGLGAIVVATLSILYIGRRFRREMWRDRGPPDPSEPKGPGR